MEDLIEGVVDRRLPVGRVRVPERKDPRQYAGADEAEPRVEREDEIADVEHLRQREHARDGNGADDQHDQDGKTGRQEEGKYGRLLVLPPSRLPVFRLPVFRRHWIGVPPGGAALSGSAAPVDVICQSVNVALMKKWRVPVLVDMGSAQA